MKRKYGTLYVVLLMLMLAGCIRIHESVRTRREPVAGAKVESSESLTSSNIQLVSSFDTDNLNVYLQRKEVYDTYVKKKVRLITTRERSMYNANGKWCFEGSDRCNGDKGGYYCAFFIPWYTPIMLVNAVALPFRTMDSEKEIITYNQRIIPNTSRETFERIKEFDLVLSSKASVEAGGKVLKLTSGGKGNITCPIDKVVSLLGAGDPQIYLTVKEPNGSGYNGRVNLADHREVASRNSYRRYVRNREVEKRRLERIAILQTQKEERERRRFELEQKRKLQRALNNTWMGVLDKCIRPRNQPRHWIRVCDCKPSVDDRGWLWLNECKNGFGGLFQMLFTPTYQDCKKSQYLYEQRNGIFYSR